MPRVLSASMSSNFSSKFADGRAREFFWGITLSKDKPEYTWTFEEEDEDKDFLEHTLFLRHAVIGAGAVNDERNLVAVTTKGFTGEETDQPLFSLTLGKNDMCQLDINFGHEVPVVFKLLEGTGPVHLSAQQLVEFPPENMDDTEMTDYTGTEDEEGSDDDEDEEKDKDKEEDSELDTSTGKGAKSKKRKVSLDKGAAKKKKGKTEESSEEEEEEEEEDESMEDEEDDDEDEDDPETPEKKKKGKEGKAKATKAKKATKAAVPAKKGKKKSK